MNDDWNDFFVRTSLGETSPGDRVGGLSSPDVIPVGIWPEPNPDKFTSADSYATFASNEPFQQGKSNYIYVRAKNSAQSTPAAGKAFMVLTDPAIVLWPGGDKWTTLKTNNQNFGSVLQPSPATGRAIAVTRDDPFVYTPTDTGHRCLVTWLSTTSHPVNQPPPTITAMDDLIKFLQDNPNYAHHNIDIIPSTTGAFTITKPFNTGTTAGSWRCGLQVTNCKGFTVYFSSGTPIPGASGQYLQLQPQTVGQNEPFAVLLPSTTLPANWDTYINWTYETNGLQPDNFEVVFVAYADVSADHPAWDYAKPYDELFEAADAAPKDTRGIALGSVSIMKGAKP